MCACVEESDVCVSVRVYVCMYLCVPVVGTHTYTADPEELGKGILTSWVRHPHRGGRVVSLAEEQKST